MKKKLFFYLLPIPGMVILILFCYIPMAGAYVAFEDYTFQGGLFGSRFVGFKNFEFFFRNIKLAFRATRNTLIINLGSMLLGIVLNVTIACILGEIRNERYRKAAQTSILFPYFLSWIVVGALAETFLSNQTGILNRVISFFGGTPIDWYVQPKYWWAILIIASLWKNFGYGSIVYYATLTGIDQCLYESASIDGAGRFQQIIHITIPLLKPTIILLFLLNNGGILGGSLEQIMGMTKMNPMLMATTDTVTTFVYRTTTQNGQFGMSSAISLYQSLFGCIVTLAANIIAKKVDPDYALF